MPEALHDSAVAKSTQIRHRFTQQVLFEAEAPDLKAVVEAAVKAGANLGGAYLLGAYLRDANLRDANLRGADLRDADLRDANLRDANLRDANLRDANLRDANLRDANLRDANLRGADLRGAYLRDANLRGADLRGADLRGADLGGAYLRGADLGGAMVPWQSHCFLAELLRRAAGEDLEKRKVAGLVLVSPDWCWRDFLALDGDPLFAWAIDALAAHVRDGDCAPEVLARRARELVGPAARDAVVAASDAGPRTHRRPARA